MSAKKLKSIFRQIRQNLLDREAAYAAFDARFQRTEESINDEALDMAIAAVINKEIGEILG